MVFPEPSTLHCLSYPRDLIDQASDKFAVNKHGRWEKKLSLLEQMELDLVCILQAFSKYHFISHIILISCQIPFSA